MGAIYQSREKTGYSIYNLCPTIALVGRSSCRVRHFSKDYQKWLTPSGYGKLSNFVLHANPHRHLVCSTSTKYKSFLGVSMRPSTWTTYGSIRATVAYTMRTTRLSSLFGRWVLVPFVSGLPIHGLSRSSTHLIKNNDEHCYGLSQVVVGRHFCKLCHAALEAYHWMLMNVGLAASRNLFQILQSGMAELKKIDFLRRVHASICSKWVWIVSYTRNTD